MKIIANVTWISIRKLYLTLLLLIVTACQSASEKEPLKYGTLVTPQGDKIDTILAWSSADQVRGLSGTHSDEFDDQDGMLFFYLEDGERAFWMPDTYFDLDLFYLDPQLKIIDVERNIPHFIGRFPEERVPRIRASWSRHVLEMRASSPIGKKLKVGDQLVWKFHLSLPQTESEIRQRQSHPNSL